MTSTVNLITVSFNRKDALCFGTLVQETEKAIKVSVETLAGGTSDKQGRTVGFAWLPKSVLIERFEGLYEVKKSFENRIEIKKY
jgi:hypothetical protein